MAASIVEDVVFHRDPQGELLARLYRPSGKGPFPVAVDLHGGAWTSGDRTQNVAIASALADAGILVVSLDFRMPPAKRYPATLADIDAGIGWTKAHAAEYGGRPDWIGGFGTSSGGHLILLAGMRPASAGSRLAFVVSGWGVIDPLLRYRLAKEAGAQNFIASHHAFWGDETAMTDGSPPAILQRGDQRDLPPTLVFQGDADEWVPKPMVEKFAAAYRAAGGDMRAEFLPGAKHSFFRDDPDGPNGRKAIALTRDYILSRTVKT